MMTNAVRRPRHRSIRLLVGIAAALLFVVPVNAQAASPAYVQGRAKQVTSGTVNNLAFTSANTAHNLIVVYVSWSNPGTVTVSDSRGNVYASAGPAQAWGSLSAWRSQIFYAKDVAGGGTTVSATFGTALNGFGKLYIHEYSGMDRTAPLDVTASRTGTALAMNSGPATTTNAADLIFGAGSSSSNVNGVGSGFTSRINSNGSRTEDKVVAATGSYSATASQNGTQWVMQMAAFKANTSDLAPPSVPTGLSATAPSGSLVNLSWTASTDNVGVAGYEVFRDGTLIGRSSTTSFADEDVADGTNYNYTVSAYDAAGNSSSQSAAAPVFTPDETAPTIPDHVQASAVSSTQTTLDWTSSTDKLGVTNYKIYRDGTFLKNSTVHPVQDAGLTAGKTYSYTVSAVDAAGNESAESDPATVTTPAADSSPPTAAMTAPALGSTVSGKSVTVSATANDNVAVAQVDFLLDGVSIGVDTTAPYSIQWDTTTTSNGPHALSARATDTAGNFGITSGVVNVTVNNPSTPPLPEGLVAGYNFSESTGTTTADVTGNGNNATILNGATWAAGKYGTGIKLDGNNDYLEIANSSTINISGNAFSFSAWVNPTGGTGDQVLFAKGYNGSMTSPYYQYAVELQGGGVTPNFLIGTASGLQGASMGTALPKNQWSHFAVVFNGTQAAFYLNGALVSTQSLSASIAQRSTPLRLGADANPGQFFVGSLDDVRVYNRTQTQTEVQTDMNTALASPAADPTAPAVSISSPANNAQVSNIVVISANASDDVGVASVQFFVDGTAVGPADTVTPYGATWDTRGYPNGAHTVTARAKDAAGNTTVSAPVTVNVVNANAFQNDILATGLNLPTAMKFLPNGNMLVAELGGKIKLLQPPYTSVSPTLFGQVTVEAQGVQQGLYDLALDPNFSTNHYYYLFYSASTDTGGWDRLSRFTATADLTGTVAGSETVLYQDSRHPDSPEHHGGAIMPTDDGHIFFSTGEHFLGSPAQDLTSPRGKLHRINMDGSVPTDNPFYDGAGPNWDSIWAYGLRNPFRGYYDAPTHRLFIGDVGGNVGTSNEEINIGARGVNYGWPDFEGQCALPCTSPLYDWEHNNRDAAVVAGFVYHGTQFPGMDGDFFFGDYAQNWIKRLRLNPDGTLGSVFNFEPPDGSADGPYGDIVYLTEGPDQSLYYIDLGYADTTGTFGVSKIRRIRYISGNQPPVVMAAANPTSGSKPLNVNFSSAGTTDPENDPISYSWDFGDGTALSTAANPSHTYTAAGEYSARLTVSDGLNTSVSPPITIQVGAAPTATITAPTDGGTFRAGDVINFAGTATDPEDGILPASAYTWTVDFLHDGHVHPGPVTTGSKTGSFTIPTSGHDFESNTRYRIMLTVTDSDGIPTSTSVLVWPQKVNLTFSTVPAGLTFYMDGVARATPTTIDDLIGFTHTIEARNQSVGSTNYTFSSWSDGGAQSHSITVPATNQSYTANFTAAQAPSGLAASWGFNENTGTTTADGSGNGNTATLVNAPTWTAGQTGHGSALSFDGTNDNLTVPNSTSLNIAGSAITLSMWLKPTAAGGDHALIGKFWNAGMTSPYYQYGIEMQSGNTVPVFEVGTSSGLRETSLGSAISTTAWTHLAIVFNGTQVQFYVNGALVSTKALSATLTARTNIMRMGADASPGQYYKGLLDDVRIYNRALSASEVLTAMNTPL
jgi:glucose/arabinose dehydrogenase/chitodextrinase